MQCSVRRARNVLFKYSDILEFDILLIVKNYRRLGWAGCPHLWILRSGVQTKVRCSGTALTLKKEVWSSTETSANIYRST